MDVTFDCPFVFSKKRGVNTAILDEVICVMVTVEHKEGIIVKSKNCLQQRLQASTSLEKHSDIK